MLNALLLAELADHIAEYFSEDAVWWPRGPRAGSPEPVVVQWIAGEKQSVVTQVVDALRLRTVAPYRSTNRLDALPIVSARPEQGPEAVITFWLEVRPDDGPGVRYELSLASSDDVWPGWFKV